MIDSVRALIRHLKSDLLDISGYELPISIVFLDNVLHIEFGDYELTRPIPIDEIKLMKFPDAWFEKEHKYIMHVIDKAYNEEEEGDG